MNFRCAYCDQERWVRYLWISGNSKPTWVCGVCESLLDVDSSRHNPDDEIKVDLGGC